MKKILNNSSYLIKAISDFFVIQSQQIVKSQLFFKLLFNVFLLLSYSDAVRVLYSSISSIKLNSLIAFIFDVKKFDGVSFIIFYDYYVFFIDLIEYLVT